MVLLAYSPEQISAFWRGVTAITAGVAGGVGILTLLSIRTDSRDRSRPVMSAELLPRPLMRGTYELIIRNVGQSVAKNVQVTFRPTLKGIGQSTDFIARRYAQLIPTVGPGRELS